VNYGSKDWLDRQYRNTADDPWNLAKRPSQIFRYEEMLASLTKATSHVSGEVQTVLDVGCATGHFTNRLARRLRAGGARVIGADLSEVALVRAKKNYPDLEFHCASIAECAEKFAGQMDVVTCLEVLYYLPVEQRVAALEDLRNTLRPGGVLLVSSMIAPPPYISPTALRKLVERDFAIWGESSLSLWPLAAVEKWLMRTGFSGLLSGSRNQGDGSLKWVVSLSRFSLMLFGTRSHSHFYITGVRR
jgi:2-polyprenyl-3-methyl-5-hydroxy-6-metoxy-1,4-benzoquinol methylase